MIYRHIKKPMAILVDTSAVEGIVWSAILDHYRMEESYLTILSKSSSDPNMGLEKAAKNGRMDLVLHFISKGANYWDAGMRGAAKGSHMDLVEYFVSQGANDWNWGMCWAAKGGHMDIVKYFDSKGANDWFICLHTATHLPAKNEQIIEFFKSKFNE